jgi:hypothetical protein
MTGTVRLGLPGRPLLVGLAALLILGPAGRARAGEAYYLLMFGSQQVPNDPNYSHTFATFVRATWPGDGSCRKAPRLEACTISWLPANGKIRTAALLPEPGRNYSLDDTLRYVLANDERVSLWGPYRIDPEVYARAVRHAEELESGEVQYKAIDAFHRSCRVSNCIHAVATVVEGSRVVVLSPGWGEVASYAVLERFQPCVIEPDRVHPWVGSALGLDNYPLIYRDNERPCSGTFLGPVNRLLGGERDLRPSYGPPR